MRAVGIIIFRLVDKSAPEMLLLQTSYNGEWAPPKGHVDPGESDLETAYRETEEEAGIKRDQIKLYPDFQEEIHYVVKKSVYGADVDKCKTSAYYLGEVEYGQKITLSHEHTDFKWLMFNDAIETTLFENYKTLYRSSKSFLVNKSVHP